MNIRFDPVAMQYVIAFDSGEVATDLEVLRSRPFPSDQTLRAEYYWRSDCRGHSHPPGNGCRYCGFYNGVRERTQPCPYSEF